VADRFSAVCRFLCRVAVYAVSTRTARDISARLGCACRSSIRNVDQPPMSRTTRNEMPAATIAEAPVWRRT
jgi:hypothetical protein